MNNSKIPVSNPFKFLDSYGKDDREIFFGRDAEIEELYDRVFASNLVVLYGESGTGKTSLINCGLYNQFDTKEWLPINVRYEGDMSLSLRQALEREAIKGIDKDAPIPKIVHSVYLDYYKPIYLIFDQFEELFIETEEEKQFEFFEQVQAILMEEPNCKLLFSLRGEYLDRLSKFEIILPHLFDNRMLLEKMSWRSLREVIKYTTEVFGIEIEEEDKVIDQIINNISDPSSGVELAYLQIYLDKLYQNAINGYAGEKEGVKFSMNLIKRTQKLEDVLSEFLEEQFSKIERELSHQGFNAKGIPLKILFALVTEKGTKRSYLIQELIHELVQKKKIDRLIIDYCLERFRALKIIRVYSDE